ncbi:MAG: NAD-dependent succinate-semialdehyde dehydrogenase [Acidobacteria bacterium]|jgi:succinate-semialdehyde dehydrogenase/glutarate-semialdehyde dehydrogenase|nr:NAD-dependent succinate-semialdehyde dehydrogenase [Acidobacteriota bacterium]
MALRSINPATGELLESFAEQTAKEAATAAARAHEAFQAWSRLPLPRRAGLVARAAAILRAEKSSLARMMTGEMGKPVLQSIAEVEKCALVCEHYAAHGEAMLAPVPIPADAAASYVRFDPLGVVLAVMPWNFPLWQVFRFAAPALLAGNACLLKHAANVTRCAVSIEDVFRRAGFPEHVFTSLRVGSAQVEALVALPEVRAVTLTGSDAAGRAVAAVAGRHLKKVVLELGGSDPFIVLADAPLAKCVAAAVSSRMINNGQSCIAAKRFIVVGDVYGRFRDAFCAAVSQLRTGNPLDESNDLGPLARADLLDDLEKQVRASVRRGARVLVGGKRGGGPGYFFQPSVLDSVTPGMPAYDEELFGPVAALIAAEGAEDALRIANDTPFGLGASIWTADRARGEELAARIEAGSVFINGMVKSDPRLPFGGIKASGFGRELSEFGIREFVNIKTVVIT